MHSSIWILVICGALSLALVVCEDEQNDSEDFRMKIYQAYLKLHNRTFVQEELPRRLELFWQRRQRVMQAMKDYEEGKAKYSLKENDFMDLTKEELNQLHNMSPPEDLKDQDSQPKSSPGGSSSAPEEKDWRKDSECIYEVLNQGRCGSCYAVATMGVVESMRCLKQGSGYYMSYQQIVDCATRLNGYSNQGCNGGQIGDSLRYLQDESEAAKAKCYENIDGSQRCKINGVKNNQDCMVLASPTDQKKLSYKVLNNEVEMRDAVAEHGPIIAMMEASDDFMQAGEGVFQGDDCRGWRMSMNHAVQIVGYGHENGDDYWIIKNSWGKDWGIDGYVKFLRGKNTCAIGVRAYAVTE